MLHARRRLASALVSTALAAALLGTTSAHATEVTDPVPTPTDSAVVTTDPTTTDVTAPVTTDPTATVTEPVYVPPGEAPPADLIIEDLVVGDGAEATPGHSVDVHYVGVAWSTRQQFDASWDRGESITFPLAGLIAGWQEGIPGMRVGGRREIPAARENRAEVVPAFRVVGVGECAEAAIGCGPLGHGTSLGEGLRPAIAHATCPPSAAVAPAPSSRPALKS